MPILMPAEAYGRDARTDAGPSHLLLRWDESSITMLCVGHVLPTSSISPKKNNCFMNELSKTTSTTLSYQYQTFS